MEADGTISFNNVDSSAIDQLYWQEWQINTEKSIEYFENDFINLKYVSFNDQLEQSLNWLDDRKPIAFDYQWYNDSKNQDDNQITLFQFCSSNGVLLISRDPDVDEIDRTLLDFMKSQRLFTKTTKRDYIKFKQLFGRDASNIKFEDITRTRLLANGKSQNYDDMVKIYCDKKPQTKFNKKRIQMLKWKYPFKKMQILFAGYRVAALYQAMKNLPEPNLHFISSDPNVPIPIQYIPGISNTIRRPIQVKPKLKYMLIYNLHGESVTEILDIIGLKKSLRDIKMLTENGETNDDHSPFDKAIIELTSVKEFHKKITDAQYKIAFIDASLWEIENEL